MYKYFLFTVNVNIKTGVLNKALSRLLVLLHVNDLFDGAGG